MSAAAVFELAPTGHERHPDDFYRTPAWAVAAIWPHLRPMARRGALRVMDPFCGDGAILDAARELAAPRRLVTLGTDVHAGRARTARRKGHTVSVLDTLSTRMRWGAPDLVVTNPPFVKARESVLAALPLARARDVAYLLRLGFLGSAERAPLHHEHPCDLYVLPKRPEFCLSVTCRARVRGKRVGCGWHVTLPVTRRRPSRCAACASTELSISTTDASEYAWFVWGPGRGGTWRVLDVPGAGSVRKPHASIAAALQSMQAMR